MRGTDSKHAEYFFYKLIINLLIQLQSTINNFNKRLHFRKKLKVTNNNIITDALLPIDKN